jgi:hypothetical protein
MTVGSSPRTADRIAEFRFWSSGVNADLSACSASSSRVAEEPPCPGLGVDQYRRGGQQHDCVHPELFVGHVPVARTGQHPGHRPRRAVGRA